MTSQGQAFDIMRSRERLLMCCAAQRLDLAKTIDQLQGPISVADRAVDVVNYVRGHPLVAGAAVALVVVIRRRGWLGWLRRGFILWRAYRAFGGNSA